MTIRPRLNVICGRCGKRREGLRHVCRSNSARRATIKLAPVLGGCARCGKPYGGRNGNPLTHVCRPRDGDFRKRKTDRVSARSGPRPGPGPARPSGTSSGPRSPRSANANGNAPGRRSPG